MIGAICCKVCLQVASLVKCNKKAKNYRSVQWYFNIYHYLCNQNLTIYDKNIFYAIIGTCNSIKNTPSFFLKQILNLIIREYFSVFLTQNNLT